MKDIIVDGRLQRVFVLTETDKRIVYISLKSIHEVDYFRLKEIEQKAGKVPMIEFMKDYKLDNGRNALKQYDELIQIADKNAADPKKGSRLRKPTEAFYKEEKKAPERKKPGPKPKGERDSE